jgi:hypothetical protein
MERHPALLCVLIALAAAAVGLIGATTASAVATPAPALR